MPVSWRSLSAFSAFQDDDLGRVQYELLHHGTLRIADTIEMAITLGKMADHYSGLVFQIKRQLITRCREELAHHATMELASTSGQTVEQYSSADGKH